MIEIDVTPIENSLGKLSNDLFLKWIHESTKKYPDKKIIISDKTCLVNDLKKSIKKALRAAQKEKDQKDLEWYIGFFYGFLEANLVTHWFMEYIIKQTNEYRIVIMIQALISQLNKHMKIVNKAEENYYLKLYSSCNFDIRQSEILASVEAVKMKMELPVNLSTQNALNSNVFTCLDNILTMEIQHITNMTNYIPIDIKKYISYEIVSCLIERNLNKI